MKEIEKYLLRAIDIIVVGSFSVMTFVVFVNVILRYAFNSGITFSEELSRLCFVWLTFLGAILAMKENAHIRVDSFIRRLSIRARKSCSVIVNVLIIYVCWLLFDGSLTQTLINLDTQSPALGIPMAFLYITGVISSVGIIIYAARNICLLHKEINAD